MGQNYMCLYSSQRLPVELVSKKQEHSRVHVSPFPVVCCWGQLSTLEPESAHTHPWSSSVGELIWRGAEHCDSLHCLCAWPKYKQPFLCLSPSLLFCHLNYSLSLSLSLSHWAHISGILICLHGSDSIDTILPLFRMHWPPRTTSTSGLRLLRAAK